MKKTAVCLMLSVLLLTALLPAGRADTLTVYPDQALHSVSPTLYGIFLEDINCAVDGGLYAELLKNRSFENENLWNPQHADHWEAWKVGERRDAQLTLENADPLHENNPIYLRIVLQEGGRGRARALN